MPSPHVASPAPRADESPDAWTDRLSREGREQGVFRQCSIGWHGECSARHDGADAECQCDCHGIVPDPPLWQVEDLALVEYDDHVELEDDEFSLASFTKEQALGLAAVLTQWARS